MKNEFVLKGDLASKVCEEQRTSKRTGNPYTLHAFRVMTEEVGKNGELACEEHSFKVFNEEIVEPLTGVGLGSTVAVKFRVASNLKDGGPDWWTNIEPLGIKVLEAKQDTSDEIPF